eukprot:jgi/Chrpa1/20206/Chrysochromulina_OHIO_Genome00005637-RA
MRRSPSVVAEDTAALEVLAAAVATSLLRRMSSRVAECASSEERSRASQWLTNLSMLPRASASSSAASPAESAPPVTQMRRSPMSMTAARSVATAASSAATRKRCCANAVVMLGWTLEVVTLGRALEVPAIALCARAEKITLTVLSGTSAQRYVDCA